MARQIIVDIVGDSSKFTKSVDQATSVGGKFGNVVKGIGLGIGAGAFGMAADAVMGFVGALGEAGDAYREDQAQQKILAQTLKNTVPGWDGNTAAVEAYASAQGRLGFADDEVRSSIGQLIGITHDQTKAMELNGLAQDLARAKGIDLAQATDIVTKAAQGNGKALKSLGVDIGGATDAAGMLDAIQKNVTGSAETWAATSEGKLAASQIKQAEAWEKIGGVVDRIQSVILPLAADAFSVIADVITNVADAVQPLIDSFMKEMEPTFKEITRFVQKDVMPVLTKVAAWLLPKLGEAVKWLAGLWRTEFQVIIEVVKTAAGILGPVIGTVVNVVGTIGTAIGNVVGTVRTSIANIISFFSGVGSKISSVTSGMWDGIWKAFKGVINTIIRGWNSLKFSMPKIDLGPLGSVGGFTIGTPNIPYLHQGGLVPGVPGSDVLAMLQAGERVVPAGKASGASIVINVNGDVYGDGIDALADKLALRLRLAGA